VKPPKKEKELLSGQCQIIDKMGHRGFRLQSMVVCYDPSVPHGLHVSLTMYL